MSGGGPPKGQPNAITPAVSGLPPQQLASAAVPEVVTQFIAVTAKQNEIREKEIEVQKYNAETERQKAANAHEFSLKSLEAQLEDRKDERKTQGGETRVGFWLSGILIVGFIGVTIAALITNKEQIIVEVVKLLAVGGGGGGIGYALGVRRGEKTATTKDP